MGIIVNVGHKNYGYTKTEYHWQEQLDYYINNVAKKYGDEFVKENVELAKDVLDGKKIDWAKYAKIGALISIIGVSTVAFLSGSAEPASATVFASFAPTVEIVDLGPLERFTNSVWWTMFKAFGYIATPLLAWAGWTLAFSGNNTGNRTTAKIMVISIAGGLLFLAGAPWAGKQLIKLAGYAFGV